MDNLIKIEKAEKIICKNCKKNIDQEEFLINLNVCPFCNYHSYISVRERIQITADEGTFKEFASNISSIDFLNFHDLKSYSDRLNEAKLKSGLNEAIIVGDASINSIPVGLGVMDFNFIGGSMGSVVGERIKVLADNCIEKRIPLIIFSASGGARMQEGIISLMQMAKTVSAINRIRDNIIPYFCVITNPTTGGVSASFVTLADVIISEPEAFFCFGGPRVIEQTLKKEIPPDFGSAERNLKYGQFDMIINRSQIKDTLTKLLNLFDNKR
ncbi:MAG: acetyl-CoA carboxylase carboxyl transferase subunit beta [Actinobacteria bacterium]|nr:acetyl-CoA carboxylase carboxyl transferase subunit beta [Actinomycetota bacterium]